MSIPSFAVLDSAIAKTLFVLLNLYVGFKLGQRSASATSVDEEEVEGDVDSFKNETKQSSPGSNEKQSDELLENDVGNIADGDLSAIRAGFTEACKMVFVVRTDLKLDSGTIASLCSKATLACYRALSSKNPQLLKHWERTGQAKIALKGKGEEQLLELEAIAKSLNLCARSVYATKPSKSEAAQETVAVLAVGPAPVPIVNEVTGSLRLL